MECRILGINHDRVVGELEKQTVTLMKKTLLPARRMHNRDSCANGWVDTELRQWLNSEYINTMPDDLVRHIQSVKKRTHNYNGRLKMTTDRLFVPSESELIGSAYYSPKEDGKRYKAFSNCEQRIMKDDDGNYRWYWTRSAAGGNSTTFVFVSTAGNLHYSNASSTTRHVPLCFTFA
jgi:hypothetical protein